MPLVQGDLLNGRYRIIEVLGHGGMGSVYRAHDESLDVDVAVKENLFTTEDYARQFRLEATILASLRHPNLPRVSDHFVMADEGQYLVMDYIEGPDLRQILEKSGPISEEEAIRIGAAICDALTFLHTRKPAVLHRDIKLGNIKLVPDGHICLVDFGLAKIIEGDQPTMTGARAMTPGYSPPEQYGSSRTDARSDVYSLGATLYAALTGFIPEDSLARALDGLELTPVRKRNPKISARVADVIEKAMQTSAANRYQSAREFKEALLGMEPASTPTESGSQPLRSPTTPTPEEPAPKKAKGLGLRSFLLAGFVVLLALAGLFYTTPEIFPFPVALGSAPTATVTPTEAIEPSATPAETATSEPTVNPSPTRAATATTAPSATPEPQPLTTPTGGGRGKIAFASSRNGLPQIYITDPEGVQQQLFVAPDGACQPKWSPDGSKLAYITPCSTRLLEYANASITVLDLSNGSTKTIPSEPGGDFDPDWSPDGKFIVFTSLRNSPATNSFTQIYKVEIETLEVTRLTTTDLTQPARQPAWSPDGTFIIYSMRRNGLWQIWRMAPDGSEPQQVLRSGANLNDMQPSWSRDGAFIYFNQTDADISAPPRLMKLDLASGAVSRLITPQVLRDANASPDGTWLVAEGTDGANLDIYLFDPQANTILALTNDATFDFDPHWRP